MSNKSKKAPSKGSNVFGSDSSDDEETSVQKVNTSLRSSRKSWVAKQTRDAIDKAIEEDPSIFEYDAIYDDLTAKKRQTDQKVQNQVDRKPKYIMQLKKAAELRKKEQDIIFEKKMKKEIDKDAEKFEDKDAFVTPSYRKILEERKAEEERLRKEEKAASGQKKDLNLFYRNLLSSRVAAREGTLDKELVGDSQGGGQLKDTAVEREEKQVRSPSPVRKHHGDGGIDRRHARHSPDRRHSRGSPDRHHSRHIPDRRDSRHSPDRPDSRHSPDRRDSRHSPDRHHSRHSPDRHDSRHSPDRHHSRHSPDRRHSRHSPDRHHSRHSPERHYSRGSPDTAEGSVNEQDQQIRDVPTPQETVETEEQAYSMEEVAKEVLRKRKAEKRNTETSVGAARERYLARKKAKQT